MTCFATFTESQSIILAAIFAALVGAVSWLAKSAVAAMLWFYGRRAREIEMLIALRAEIETAVESLHDYAVPEAGRRYREEVTRDPTFRIFAPLDRTYFIFDQVKPNISQLPEAPIRHVVTFYDGMGGIDTLLASFQEERFEGFAPERRATYFDHMVAAATAVRSDGLLAMAALTAARDHVVLVRNVAVGLATIVAGLALCGLWMMAARAAAACGPAS